MSREANLRALSKKKASKSPNRLFLKKQEELEDLLDLRAIREARADPENQKRRSFFEVAKELGWERPTTKRA